MASKRRSYFIWLLDFVGCTRADKVEYSKLFKEMMDREFEWTVFNDDSRMRDGLSLRQLYHEEVMGAWDAWLDQAHCTMLEMVVALAHRCEWDVMHDDDIGDRTNFWFWEMLRNSGLMWYDNTNFDRFQVRRILDRIVERRYDSDGNGGLFLVKKSGQNLREVNLWYQMHWWLKENFDE